MKMWMKSEFSLDFYGIKSVQGLEHRNTADLSILSTHVIFSTNTDVKRTNSVTPSNLDEIG